MIDSDKLRRAVADFEFRCKPASGTCGTPATVDDVNAVIKGVSKLFKAFIDEIDKDQR